jgi:hypothetical protein
VVHPLVEADGFSERDQREIIFGRHYELENETLTTVQKETAIDQIVLLDDLDPRYQ